MSVSNTGTNLDYAETLRLTQQPAAPQDEYLAATWDMIYSKLGTAEETWRDRFVRWIGQRLIGIILRDPDFRRRLCLSLSAEMRAVDTWLDKPKPAPPAPRED